MFLPKYQAQYCALLAQFGSERSMFYGSDPIYSKMIEPGSNNQVTTRYSTFCILILHAAKADFICLFVICLCFICYCLSTIE